ncbi:MAG: Rrf2 family transcriptional regulator [Planctomycetota bacterium]|nr:Rrf2 family transcriptional regulator [Planctomycetota bacterium]
MRLSKTCVQAVMAMTFLADQPTQQPIQAKHVAAHLAVPADSALKILQALVRQGLLDSRLGRSGGYSLGKPAQKVTLLQILEAIDGPVNGQLRLVDASPGTEAVLVRLQAVCDQAAASLRQSLEGITLAELQRAGRATATATSATPVAVVPPGATEPAVATTPAATATTTATEAAIAAAVAAVPTAPATS